jgi:integrase/recombinase XerC
MTSLDNVDRQTLRGYMAHLAESGMAKRSVARNLSAIRSFYRYLVREKLAA